MLKDNHAFPSFAVDNLDRAEEFYGQTLGLDVKRDQQMGLLELHLTDGFQCMVYPKPDYQPATFTVFNFLTKDLEKTVDELTEKGVPFEHYDTSELKTNAKGIADGTPGPSIAWFKDPAGNILAVIEDK
jgi:catechol 2,3-dioxygenase-like lactoylglutathione lyase family enzyme